MYAAEKTTRILVLLCAVLCAGAADGTLTPAPTTTGDEQRLLAEQHRLEKRVARLRQEQDYLLFQQVFQQSASKYLVLDLAAGKGMLKYRNRVLRIFPLFRKGRLSGRPGPGMLALSEKTGQSGSNNRQLVFGDTLVLESRYRKSRGGHAIRYGLLSQDLAALGPLLELGARAYVIPNERK
jgi:hypothetical protein